MTMMKILFFLLCELAIAMSAFKPEKVPHDKLEDVIGELSKLKSNYTAEVNELHSFVEKALTYKDLETMYKSELSKLTSQYEVKTKDKLFDLVGLTRGYCAPCLKALNKSNECDCRNLEPMRDCLEFHQQGFRMNGIYKINSKHSMDVYCDQTSQGGGWTVFQRRQDGSVNFQRKWNDYKNGFGKLDGDFWLGNENIHLLTLNQTSLLINMKSKGSQSIVNVRYSSFSVGDEGSGYKLTVAGHNGVLNDRLSYHNEMKFSTVDKDNDKWSSNCAARDKSGWWYHSCTYSDLNRPINNLYWASYGPVFSEMKVRRKA